MPHSALSAQSQSAAWLQPQLITITATTTPTTIIITITRTITIVTIVISPQFFRTACLIYALAFKWIAQRQLIDWWCAQGFAWA